MRAIPRRGLAVLLASACVTALVAVAGCGAPAARAVESTAMVVRSDTGDVLFVDQDTQEPYLPTIPDGAVLDANGSRIDARDLASGNVVRVTGTGTMTRSYPAQYPGITRVQVVDEGTPADAERYRDVIASVFPTRDEDNPPFAWLDYRTADALVTVSLEPAGYDWRRGNAEVGFVDAQAGPDLARAAADGLPGATVDGPCEATVSFEEEPTAVTVIRWNEVQVTAGTAPAEGETVAATLASGATTLDVEPGWRYLITANFGRGSAEYAFVVSAANTNG